MSKFPERAALGVALALMTAPAMAQDAPAGGPLGLGRAALPEEIAAWDVKVMPDGRGLPEGSGDVMTGEERYLEHCAVCHGDFAEGLGNWPKLSGGEDTLDRQDPVKTIGSYWPYLSTVWDYVHRSMPFGQAQILTADDTYAITAYLLYSNYLVEEDFVLSRDNFLEVELPNADGFFADDRDAREYEEFSAEPCMENCKDNVEITRHASVLDVTPEDTTAPAGGGLEGGAATEVEAEAETPSATDEPAATEPPAAEAPAEDAAAEPAAEDPATDTSAAAPAEAPAAPAEPDPALVAAGEKVFGKCKACHMVGDDAKNRVGPILNGIIDRPVASSADYKYSKSMAEAGAGGMVWDDANLHAYLADPRGFVPGTKMTFAGLKKREDIDAVIAYLRAHP